VGIGTGGREWCGFACSFREAFANGKRAAKRNWPSSFEGTPSPAAFCSAFNQEFFDRPRLFSSGVLYDEAQPTPEREVGEAFRVFWDPSFARRVNSARGFAVDVRSTKLAGELTGLRGVCLSPAAGAHGELAGLMTIRRAHEANGQGHRTVILCPDSAHGTNPATAAMCGYTIRVIPTKDTGCVDVETFQSVLGDGKDVAGMMVTNPNTCGLFEKDIVQIAELLHKAGGYFYCDGANFNALVGSVRPVDFGVDVMHINLHKTFSTPHGGGGPGSGPICVTKELEPYLPVPCVVKKDGVFHLETLENRPSSCGRIKGFHGQFGMHIRALAYMLSHGKDGLRQVSRDAVLSANYILANLKEDFHAPFADRPCMHECLLTDKKQKDSGVTTIDIAKTLIEYGMHPMTIYFPLVVSGAMLIEPTETESKDMLDRFIAVMKMIASTAQGEKAEDLQVNPVSAPRRRLDEVGAARNPRLKWCG
jgi:glycine dehydrogenase subunit 2